MKHWIDITISPNLQSRIQEAVQGFVGEKVDGTEARAQKSAEDCAWLLFDIEQMLAEKRDGILEEEHEV